MKKEHVLFINYEYPPLGGGGGNATEQIAKKIVQKGVAVSVLTSRFKGLPKEEAKEGVRIIRMPTLRRHVEKCSVFEMIVFIVVSLFYVIPLQIKLKSSFVICFFSIPCGPAALLLKWVFGIPYIIALRGGDVPGFLPEQLARFHWWSGWLTKLIWRFSLCLTTNSKGLAELAYTFDSKRNVEIIPNGVDEKFFFKRSLGVQKDKLDILTVGRLTVQKKIERLIEAMHRLSKKDMSHIVLRIAGDGPERALLEEKASHYGLLDKTVFFLGWRTREDLREDYRKADVFALTSDYEGMPNVILEAMASSLAVIATPAPGTVDLIEVDKNGFLISTDNQKELDESFLTLCHDREKLFSFQNGSFQMAQKYSWDHTANEYYALYKKCISCSG